MIRKIIGILCPGGCGKVITADMPRHRVEFLNLGRNTICVVCMDCTAEDVEAAHKPIN